MKKLLIIVAILAGLGVVVVGSVVLFTPTMDKWGATPDEIAATYPGDELVADPKSFVNHAITIQASPERIYPWLLQLGADKGGMYSYTALEGLIRCPMVNADSIHTEWQNLQVGDPVKLCAGDFAPPPYIVAQLHPNQAVVLGHQENGKWVDLWQFVLVPQADGSTRLIVRTRTEMVGGFWDVIHPGVFLMETGMMNGIKVRAEQTAQSA